MKNKLEQWVINNFLLYFFFSIINIIRAVLYCCYVYMEFDFNLFEGYFKGLTKVRYDVVWFLFIIIILIGLFGGFFSFE